MTQGYQEPGISITSIVEDIAAEARTSRLPTAVIGECYWVETQTEASGSYDGTEGDFTYPNRPSGTTIDMSTGYAPRAWVQRDGVNYEITDNAAVTIDGTDVTLAANLVHSIQAASTGASKGTNGHDGNRLFNDPSAKFIDNGVQADDIIRVTGGSDFTIVAVISQTRVQLRATNPVPPSAQTTVASYTVVRPLKGTTDNPAKVLITYRAKRSDLNGDFLQASGVDDLRTHFGRDGIDSHWNPIGFAMSLALSASNSTVAGVPADNDSLTSYTAATEEMNKRRVYNIVPLTMDKTLQDSVISHVDDSSDRQNRERRTYISREIADEGTTEITSDSDGAVAAGTSVLTSTNVGNWATAGVEVGDSVTITAGTGITNGTYAVTTVSTTDLTLASDPKASASTAASGVTFTITGTRDFTKEQEAQNAAATARGLNNERVTLVGPDKVTMLSGGTQQELDGYYLAVAKAGQRTAASVGQPLIRATVPFATNINKGRDYFNQDQLNTLAGAGWQLFVRDAVGAPVYCRDELTTRQGLGPKYGQESEVVARDYAAYLFRDSLQPLIGSFNITPQTIDTIRLSANAVVQNLLREVYQPFTAITITSIAESTVNAGRVEINVRMTQSDPLTGIDVTIVV